MIFLGVVSDESQLISDEDTIADARCSHLGSDQALPIQPRVLRRRSSSSTDHLLEGNAPAP